MRIRGPSVSAGTIVLSCLNLPGNLRYHPENVFPVAVIPGPDEPTLTDINHYFHPLVDSLLKLWDPGVFFSRTESYPDGRLYRAALLPLIADYPAARKALGVKISPRANTYFCIYCDIPRNQIHEWLDIHPTEYPGRTAEEHQAQAFEWRDATSAAAQKAVFEKNGIRYTELLRLPYWDPTRFMVVDPMHNLFLGLIQSHFRGFLGIKINETQQSLRTEENQELVDTSAKHAKSQTNARVFLEE
ncbi:hypothetical protein M422DRAFT_58762 [Sphaerobolus stellatus SS14]|nr:hypothetical protein M422DRAFT_58762 [Sphaerobolus stellatus SS14]